MQNELLKMRRDLSVILNRNNVLKQAVREVSKIDIIRGSLIARSAEHQSIQVDRILEGELQKDISIGDYAFIQNFCSLIRAAYNYLDMGNSVDINLLVTAYRILSEDDEGGLRTDVPIVYGFSHVPPEPAEVEGRLAESLRKIYTGALEDDIAARAMYMHNCIIEVWPFERFSGEIAVFAANYYLMEQGLMPIDMPVDRQEYMDMVASALKGIRPDEEYFFFRKAIMDKMAGTIEVCKGYL